MHTILLNHYNAICFGIGTNHVWDDQEGSHTTRDPHNGGSDCFQTIHLLHLELRRFKQVHP